METRETRIVFLSVPESLRGMMESPGGHSHQEGEEPGHAHPGADFDSPGGDAPPGFSIDPAIPLPVELPAGENASAALENLSWEMIVAGMLKVITAWGSREDDLAIDLDPADIAYYRGFVRAVRPGIMGEFIEAAVIHARNKSFDTALEILSVLKALFPGAPEPLLNQALVLEIRGDALEQAGREAEAEAEYQRTHETYRELLSGENSIPNALFNAGFFYMKRRNFAKAREYFSAYLPVAEDGEKKGRAAAIVREITGKNLDDELFREAYDFIRLGEEEKGVELVREFLDRHGSVWNGWFLLGWAFRKLGRWREGEEAFRKALDLGGLGSDTRNELAICLMEQGNYRAARKELEKALRSDPENSKIISNLGVVALKTGNKAEAAGFFRTVLEIEPDDPIAGKYLDAAEEFGP